MESLLVTWLRTIYFSTPLLTLAEIDGRVILAFGRCKQYWNDKHFSTALERWMMWCPCNRFGCLCFLMGHRETLASLSFLTKGKERWDLITSLRCLCNLTSECVGLSSRPSQKSKMMAILGSWSQFLHYAFKKRRKHWMLPPKLVRSAKCTLDSCSYIVAPYSVWEIYTFCIKPCFSEERSLTTIDLLWVKSFGLTRSFVQFCERLFRVFWSAEL